MQAPFELNVGRQHLQNIISSFPPDSQHWNESQNRFQFVDRLLTECLGWERPHIEVEHWTPADGRADYLLGVPPKAIVEAKRESLRFDVPPVAHPALARKLRPLLEASKVFGDAVAQVMNYCLVRGAPIGIVCNGPQLALFQAVIVGESPLDGECFFFDGFETYLRNFPLLWRYLSPEGVAENKAYRELALHRNPRIPAKASVSIPEPFRYRYRSNFQENLRALSSILLEDIEEHPEVKPQFYRECYVPTKANNRHLLLSKRIIASRYNRAPGNNVSTAPVDDKVTLSDNGILAINEQIVAESLSARPIVVVGDVGVGKTSFFENLYEKLDKKQRQSSIFLHINLGIRATLTTDVKSYILQEIPTRLKQLYGIDIRSDSFVKSVYHEEEERFANSLYGRLRANNPKAYTTALVKHLATKVESPDVHLHASLGHLAKGQGKQIILIIDNADQRDFETQQQAFLIAQELASSRNLLVFVALRPSTFYRSKMTGALAGYQNRMLTVAPPPADEVLEKRITFAVRVAEGQIAPEALQNIRLNVSSVVLFLTATLRSIRTNEEIRTFLSNITGGNTRQVIELITGFCGSPNVDSEKIANIEYETGDYRIPLHEFTKHALLGEYAYFNAQSSLVACNVYDVTSADSREHYLAPLVIGYLCSSLGKKDNDGFLSGRELLQEMARQGFLEDQIRSTLKRLCYYRLIETPHAQYRELEVPDDVMPDTFYYRATSIGVYHTRFWMTSFGFLDATSTDTPIFDEKTRDAICQVAASFEIGERLRRATLFRTYLEEGWHRANINTTYMDFAGLVRGQESSFDSVRRFLRSQRRPKSSRRRRA